MGSPDRSSALAVDYNHWFKPEILRDHVDAGTPIYVFSLVSHYFYSAEFCLEQAFCLSVEENARIATKFGDGDIGFEPFLLLMMSLKE